MAGLWPHQYAPHGVTPSDSRGFVASAKVRVSHLAIMPHATSPKAGAICSAFTAAMVNGDWTLCAKQQCGDA